MTSTDTAEFDRAGFDRGRLRSIIGGAAGNLVEWYDWYVYSAFALYFAPIFFPSGDATAQLLNAAAVFAVGFVMRPVGAWIMGAALFLASDLAGWITGTTINLDGGALAAGGWYRDPKGLWTNVPVVTGNGFNF